VPDARNIGDTWPPAASALSLGANVYNPTKPMPKVSFNMLAVSAEFEADLLKMRTHEAMAIARSRRRLKAASPSPPPRQQAELVRMHGTASTPSPS